jgi:CcmD family protein
MAEYDNIYFVFAIILVIWLGLAGYVFHLGQKIKKLEQVDQNED